MRIIAGEFKSRRLSSPRGAVTRPSTEKVRGALFNSLGEWIEGKQVLDLYAGTGAIGLEALSRGAARASFIESNPLVINTLKSNIDHLKVSGRCTLYGGEVLPILHRLGGKSCFDLIYADPPYNPDITDIIELIRTVEAHALLCPGGYFYLETSGLPSEHLFGGLLQLKRTRRYGKTYLWELGYK